MSSTPKTIQIFLPSGEPHGIRIAEITTRIVQVIRVRRSLLADLLAMEQSSQVGVYVLVGEDTGDDNRRVYVGQSGDLRARLALHFRHQQPHPDPCPVPGVARPAAADCMEIFETGSTLFSTLGFPLFDPLATATEAENPAELFFCRSPGAGVDGKGLYTPEGIVVLADSVGRLKNVPSIQGSNDARVRERLIAAGVMEVSESGTITFPRDHRFRSPSSAASALLARSLSQVKRG
jgi:hypothetical protein